MIAKTPELWELVWGKPQIDPDDLALAVKHQAEQSELDYRTRLLIRDSIEALRSYWGPQRLQDWLRTCPLHNRLESICREQFDRVGFPFIRESLVEKTSPEIVQQLLRELSTYVHKPTNLIIGGSIALILPGYLSRSTTDIDVVDQVPDEIRNQHQLITELQNRYRLLLTHFQSHYLPSGFLNRLRHYETFGNLSVYLVDGYDIFLGKLTSIRIKDRDDLRMLGPQLDKNTLVQRLKDSMSSTFVSEELKKRAEQNWYILFGEPLPSCP